MKKIIKGVVVLAVSLLISQITQAQGTIYLSNLDQSSTGSLAVGSNSWLAAGLFTGNNTDGYTLNSVQLGMTDAFGSPNGFKVMLYSGNNPSGLLPVSSLSSLSGSADPATGGIFTYVPASNITLSPSTPYFIVLTAGTAIANGAYEWSVAGANSYNPSDGWSAMEGVVLTSSNGSFWHEPTAAYLQFAINATVVPEPGVLGLFGLGGLFLAWHRRKAKA